MAKNTVALDPETGKLSSEKAPFDATAMDEAAADAENDLENIPEETITAMAEWWKKWFMKAGHKRLGRVLLAQIKK